jgi:predicted CxxxxCH...CXXCH cytochrome family protein
MSQITKFTIMGLLLLAGLLFMAGCGSSTPNSKASSGANTEGQHAADWLPAGHMVAAQEDQSACVECHGSNYDGGISAVSCTTCHLGGAMSIHPTSWGTGTGIDLNHAAYAASNGTGACANAVCHGTNLTGVANSGPSCSSCHLGGATSLHPASFGTTTRSIDLNHGSYVTTNGAAACQNNSCHGSSLTGVAGSGPACVTATCHQNGSPLIYTGCTSCHGNPPTGTVAPNRRGAHAAHNALSSGGNLCDTCHSGAGTNTLNHFNGIVEVLLLSTYNAKSVSATYNADGTCSKVSCHGGQQTPAWLTGTIEVNTQCTSCHVYGTAPATPEYDSYYSGRHLTHFNAADFPCTTCHDTTKLAVDHFTTLNTTTMEGSAPASLNSNLNYTGGTCTPACHTAPPPTTRSW